MLIIDGGAPPAFPFRCHGVAKPDLWEAGGATRETRARAHLCDGVTPPTGVSVTLMASFRLFPICSAVYTAAKNIIHKHKMLGIQSKL